MEQGFFGQDGRVGQPGCRVLILVTARHGVQKIGTAGGRAKIDPGHDTGRVRGNTSGRGSAVFETGTKDATFQTPIGLTQKARRVATGDRGKTDMPVAAHQLARSRAFDEIAVFV